MLLTAKALISLQFSFGAQKLNCNDVNDLTFKSDTLLDPAKRALRARAPRVARGSRNESIRKAGRWKSARPV